MGGAIIISVCNTRKGVLKMNNKQKQEFINIVFEKLHIYLYIEEAEKWHNAMVSILEEFNKKQENCKE